MSSPKVVQLPRSLTHFERVKAAHLSQPDAAHSVIADLAGVSVSTVKRARAKLNSGSPTEVLPADTPVQDRFRSDVNEPSGRGGPIDWSAIQVSDHERVSEPVQWDKGEPLGEPVEPGLTDVAQTAKTVLSGAAIGWLTKPKKERQPRRVPWPAKIAAVLAALISTGAALAISYTETMALGQHAGYSEGMSLLVPLTADGLLMTGVVTAGVRILRGDKPGFRPILALIVGGSAAIGANVAARYFGVDGDAPQELWPWIPVVIAAYVPVSALLAAEQGLALIKGGAK